MTPFSNVHELWSSVVKWSREAVVRRRAPAFSFGVWHVLIDVGTNAVLASSKRIEPLIATQEGVIDSRYISRVHDSFETPFPLALIAPDQYPTLSWNRTSKILTPTHPDILTEGLRLKSKLSIEKVRTLTTMIDLLNTARTSVRTGIAFQETVYLEKKWEAWEFKKTGYDSAAAFDFPFVLQYADFKKISLQQAANDILFKAKIANDIFAKTELLRLRYWDKVRTVRSPDELASLLDEFRHDCYLHARI